MELLKTGIPLFLNLAVMAAAGITLCRLRRKKDILKYYTYLSNLVALIGSSIFVAAAVLNLPGGSPVPLWVKGLRFTGTYMLTTAMFVFTLVLLPVRQEETVMTEDDFTGIRPKMANFLLHYFCPVASAVSFLLLERQPVLANPQWTLYAAVPTILYWSVYLILTAFNLWKDPYGFSQPQKKPASVLRTLTDILLFLLIPAISMGLDYLLWWINTLNF